MKTRALIPFAAVLFAASACTGTAVMASTITAPGVIIEVVNGTNAITWDTAIAESADVEFSGNLEIWTKVSTNNSTGVFQHPVGGATRGFYRLRWTPSAMVTVQGGTMPSPSGRAGQSVADFSIGRYEVTWDEWQAVRTYAVAHGYDLNEVGAGSGGNHPARDVLWYEAVKWCNAKSEMNGLTPVYLVDGAPYKTGQAIPDVLASANGYRLPSDLEWEWAARGGLRSQGYTYSGSDDLALVGWAAREVDGTQSVGLKLANELGLYDMSGNVFEWCFDVTSFDSPTNPSRRLRGGSWNYGALSCDVGYRASNAPGDRFYRAGGSIGFRVARNAL